MTAMTTIFQQICKRLGRRPLPEDIAALTDGERMALANDPEAREQRAKPVEKRSK